LIVQVPEKGVRVRQMACQETQKPGSETCSADRRKNRRLAVQLDVLVHLMGPSSRPLATERAVTLNVSPSDMYFESTLGDRLHIGQIVSVDIELPMGSSTVFTDKQLGARGRVVRLGPSSIEEPSRRGVAVVFLEVPAFHAALV
jgi:hypothetical protein